MINFEKLIVHNFGSYSHSEVNLQNKGFCLVTGKNEFKKDNAHSNGSGKSFLWNAICYVLTGETVNGLHTNLKNINITEDPTCYVTLIFTENSDHYQITRHVTPKSDLKIIKNDIDLSGKGIRESEKKLSELLPDLTKNLITSTIIIGQGMPNKFSSFSPSGRKELLEKLTRADFMIEDIKQRVSTRLTDLGIELRALEDAHLARQSQLNIHNQSVRLKTATLETLVKPDFETQIAAYLDSITKFDKELTEHAETDSRTELALNNASNELFRLNTEKSKELDALKAELDRANTELIQKQATLKAEIQGLNRQIAQYEAIKDICPTCGQHIPGAHKPDTSSLKEQVKIKSADLVATEETLKTHNMEYQARFTAISSNYEQQMWGAQTASTSLREQLTALRNTCKSIEQSKFNAQQSINRLQYERDTWDTNYANLVEEINNLNTLLTQLSAELATLDSSIEDKNEHIKVVKKMDTLIKRDFRGYLLSNIILYINKKAKEYCNIVFGTQDLEVALEGNDLNISYCGKMFDNLSGGEKQRVDLILQFAIRNMLTAYLNFNSNILVLDEITDFLDKKSCAAVLELVTKELNTIESVFIISHHAAELELPIDSELKVVKNEDGISEILAGV